MLASVLELATLGCAAFKDVGCAALVAGALGTVAPAGVAATGWIVAGCMLLFKSHTGVYGMLAAGSIVVAGLKAIRV